jgi:hypothetical protein
LTKLCGVYAVVLLVAFASAGRAADAEKKTYEPILPPVNFEGNYSLKLHTEKPKASDLDAPPALTPLRDDSPHPFVGLKLTKPLESK